MRKKMDKLTLLNARNWEVKKFLNASKWVLVANWNDKDIPFNEILQVHAQAWEEGESTEDAMESAFPDHWEEIAVCTSNYEDFDIGYYREAKFKCYYMGELFEQSTELIPYEKQEIKEEDDFTNDDYETPDWLAKKMAELVLPTDREILEPFAGSGQIAKYLPSDRLIECVETKYSRFLRGKENAQSAVWINGNFFDDNVAKWGCDLIITNPPFSKCIEAVTKSLALLNDSPNSRLLFLMPLDWNCAQSRAKAWESLDAHIHHIYPVSTRIDYLKNGIPMSKCQKTINGVPQFDKNGKPIRNSGRQCYDAVFDIRLGKAQSASTLIFKYV